MKRYQVVSWWPDWHGFAFVRLNLLKTDLALIYDWCLFLGFWEIRRWSYLIGRDESGQKKETPRGNGAPKEKNK